MANVLWSGSPPVGILDWESATAEGLPLMDLYYATVDAVHTARAMPREDAFTQCVAPRGSLRPEMAALIDRLPSRAAITGDVAAAALHASTLHHAMNERSSEPNGGRPFLRVAGRAAALVVPAEVS
jgi:aminoglycoside phosphotransferase (APT) family kinase protein